MLNVQDGDETEACSWLYLSGFVQDGSGVAEVWLAKLGR
jgi:hypothetical protein